MAPVSLGSLRHRIEALADRDGRFCVACARTGTSPVPVDGLRFPDRETAGRAAALAVRYRARLRRWDRRARYHDLVVHELAATDRAPSLLDAVHRTARRDLTGLRNGRR